MWKAKVKYPSGYRGVETRTRNTRQAQVGEVPHPFRTARSERRAQASVRERRASGDGRRASVETPAPGPRRLTPGKAGGIAQLAERQLCKLDVAGSNPAASTSLRQGFGRQAEPRAGLRESAMPETGLSDEASAKSGV